MDDNTKEKIEQNPIVIKLNHFSGKCTLTQLFDNTSLKVHKKFERFY